MKFLISGVVAVVMAVWIVAIALVSIQNVLITDADGNKAFVTLQFLGFTSIPLPFGLTLALSAALGMIVAAIALPLWTVGPRQRLKRSPRATNRRS